MRSRSMMRHRPSAISSLRIMSVTRPASALFTLCPWTVETASTGASAGAATGAGAVPSGVALTDSFDPQPASASAATPTSMSACVFIWPLV